MQTEQLALVADRLPLAAVKRLHHAKLRILAEVPDGEGVAVDRNDSGDHEKHRPQGDEKSLDDVQGDDLAGKGEAVEQALIGHLLAAVFKISPEGIFREPFQLFQCLQGSITHDI